jgi:hypothetical protein
MHVLQSTALRLCIRAGRIHPLLRLRVRDQYLHAQLRLRPPVKTYCARFAVLVVLAMTTGGAGAAELIPLRVRIEPKKAGLARVIPLLAGTQAHDEQLTDGTAVVLVPLAVPSLLCAGAAGTSIACEVVQLEAAEERVLAMVEGREVRMRCLIGRDPAKDATIRLHRADIPARVPYAMPLTYTGGSFVDRVLTNANGEAVIPHLAPGTYRFEISVRNYPLYDAGEIEIPPRQALPDGSLEDRSFTAGDFVIASGGTVEVEVLDTASIPLTSGRVAIGQRRGRTAPLALVEGDVDGTGHIRLSGLDLLQPAQVTCLTEGYERKQFQVETLPPLLTCTLTKLASIAGNVTDESGQPIADADVRIGEHTAETDDAGEFRLTGLPAGEAEIVIRAERYAHASRTVQLIAGEMTPAATFILKPGWKIAGRVVDAMTKEPVRGALVRRGDQVGTAAVTGDDGAYELDAENLALLEADGPGYALADRVVTGRDRNDFLLQRPGTMIVAVWDERNDRPCVGCTVVASRGRLVRSAITNGTAEARFDGLPPGDYDVLNERVHATSSYVTVSGGEESVTANVSPNATSRVRLGRRRDVDVVFVPAASGRRLRASGARGVEIVDAEASGSFRISHQADGAQLALVTAAGGVVVGAIPPHFGASTIELRLSPTLTTIRCTKDGRPTAGVFVTIRDVTGELAAWGTSDMHGEVQLANLPPARYRIAADSASVDLNVRENTPGVIELADH